MKLAIFNIGENSQLAISRRPWPPATPSLSTTAKSSRSEPAAMPSDCDVAIDADGMMAMPGLIDSHVHITFGDYTPRQKTVGFLESYTHGGVTTCISASEVHVPGRPRDPAGVKALAIAARKSFEKYRPGGMRVHAGSIILEPGLVETDFAELAKSRRLAGEGWLRRVRDALRICALRRDGEASRHGHDGAYRRLVNSGFGGDLGRSCAQDAAGRILSRQRRADRHARCGFSTPGRRE